MITLERFESDLKALIGKPTIQRPFVCEGSPLKCETFIAGFNPATSMEADFWQFWDSDYGYNKVKWIETYIEERKTRSLALGKTRRNSISATRRVIEWVLEGASQADCLETNIYGIPTPAASDLAQELRDTANFNFLLDTIKPKIIIAHGEKAVEHLQNLHLSAHIIPVSHFSRGWSKEAALELGKKINTHLMLS